MKRDSRTYQDYLEILREELVPAAGCTEPVAIAYAAALGREVLGELPERTTVEASGNIIKNVKSVVVPNTGGLKGIEAAAAAGLVAGEAERLLEVIAMEPAVLVLDEPTAGLDPVGVEGILGNIRDYHQAKNATIVIVSHSMEEMARTVDRIVVVDDGRIPFSGSPREVFAHGDELERMGLGVPQMTRVFHRLRAMGVDIDPSVYTIEQAKAAVLEALKKKGVR